jgi:hypothetical protein
MFQPGLLQAESQIIGAVMFHPLTLAIAFILWSSHLAIKFPFLMAFMRDGRGYIFPPLVVIVIALSATLVVSWILITLIGVVLVSVGWALIAGLALVVWLIAKLPAALMVVEVLFNVRVLMEYCLFGSVIWLAVERRRLTRDSEDQKPVYMPPQADIRVDMNLAEQQGRLTGRRRLRAH